MVTNTASVAHDACTVERAQMVHKIIKENNNKKTTNIESHTLKSKLMLSLQT